MALNIGIYFHRGKKKGQRVSTGVFTYTKPKTQTEKNHNKGALAILEVKKSQMILEGQSVGSKYIPSHKIKSNFLDGARSKCLLVELRSFMLNATKNHSPHSSITNGQRFISVDQSMFVP